MRNSDEGLEKTFEPPAPGSMPVELRQQEITELETKIEREEAIDRLNAGRVTEDERKEYGFIFDRLVALRKVGIREELTTLDEQVARLALSHEERLAAAGLRAHASKH